jgi:hypothetical protein
MKDAARRDKMSAPTGKDTWSGQDPGKPSVAGDLDKNTAGLWTKGNLRADVRKPLPGAEIIPGDWGKVEAGWLLQPLESSAAQRGQEAGFTGFRGGVRAPPFREQETARPGAMRNRSEPGQVIQAGFEPG